VNDVATSLPVVLNEQGPDGNITYGYGLGLIEEAVRHLTTSITMTASVALSPSRMLRETQAAYAYDAWGKPLLSIPDSVGTKNRFRFTGEALDPGTGLYYLRRGTMIRA